MSIISATFEVQSRLQKIVPPPYYVDAKRQLLLISPLYCNKHHKKFRNIQQFAILFLLFPFFFVRLVWLFCNWKEFAVHHMEQVVLYGIVVCLMFDYIAADHLQMSNFKSVIHLVNQSFSIVTLDGETEGTNNNFELPMFGKVSQNKIFLYGFSVCFAMIAPSCFAAPFALSYLPLQLVFGPHIAVKLCESCIYGFSVAYGASVVLSVNLIAVVFICNIISYAKTLTPTTNTKPRFFKYFKRYRKCQILLYFGALIYTNFLMVFIFVGIVLASGCACITVKMYGKINVLIYLLFPSMTIICVANAIVLTYLASIPLQRCQKFKSWWTLMLSRMEDMKTLKACKQFGFDLGPYGICTAALGLRICDDYIQNTVTIILLGFI